MNSALAGLRDALLAGDDLALRAAARAVLDAAGRPGTATVGASWESLLATLDPEQPDTGAVVTALAAEFAGSAVSLFWSLHGVLYLSATTDAPLREKAERGSVRYRTGEGLTGRVFRDGGALRFDNANDPDEVRAVAPERTGPLHAESTGDGGAVQRSLLVPVRHLGEPRGVLRLSRVAPCPPYTEADLVVVQRFADLLGRVMGDHWELLLFRTMWGVPSFSVIVSHDPDPKGGPAEIVAASPGAGALTGAAPELLVGRDAFSLYVDPTAARAARRQTDAKAGPHHLLGKAADGRPRPIAIHYQQVANRLVVPAQRYTVGLAFDDAPRTEAEVARTRLEEVLEALDTVYFRTEVGGKALEVSKAEGRITGHLPGQGADQVRLWPSKAARDAFIDELRSAPQQTVHDRVLTLRHKHGHELKVLANARLARDPASGVEVIEGTYRDISARIELQKQLEGPTDQRLDDAELHQRLLRQQSAQRAFLASVGHQLKAPLANVLNGLRNARDGWTPSEHLNERLGRLAIQVQRALELVRGLSLLQHALRGERVRIRTVSLGQLCRRLADDFNPTYRRARLRLDIEVAPGVVAQAEPDLLRQVVYNLLDNAAKYSHPDTTVRVRAQGHPVCLDVMSRGLPIPEGERERVFEWGYRTVAAQHAQAQGTGLGLWLVRELCRSMGATARCLEEAEGDDRWTVFRVQFREA